MTNSPGRGGYTPLRCHAAFKHPGAALKFFSAALDPKKVNNSLLSATGDLDFTRSQKRSVLSKHLGPLAPPVFAAWCLQHSLLTVLAVDTTSATETLLFQPSVMDSCFKSLFVTNN